MRIAIRIITAAVLAATLTACGPGGDGAYIILLVASIAVIFACLFTIGEQSRRKAEAAEEAKKAEEEAKARREERRRAYEAALAALRESAGEADKTIVVSEYDLDGEIRAYSSSRTVVILGRSYAFADVLDCSMSDDYSVRRGSATIDLDGESSPKTGSAVGRAVAGGAARRRGRCRHRGGHCVVGDQCVGDG